MADWISVVIPAFNRPCRLMRAVESVLEQQGVCFELVVVDDGSNEDLSPVMERVENAGHIWIRQDNQGVASARNRGVGETRGDWIAFLDSDDRWLPGKLATQYQWHEENPTVGVSQCLEQWFRPGRDRLMPAKYCCSGWIFPEAVDRCCLSSSSVMFRREIFERVGGQDPRYRVCEDYAFWLRVTSTHEVGLVPQVLVEKYGGNPDQLSMSYPALDRMRLVALLEFRLDPLCPEKFFDVVENGIREKAEILFKGAIRRDRQREARLFERMMLPNPSDYAERLRELWDVAECGWEVAG